MTQYWGFTIAFLGVYQSSINYDDSKEIHLQEFLWAKEFATKPLKVCVTAFNTIAEWSYT
ncbi:MAG: hypothetical protein HeimC2_32560, partial [Candidatus Heimdallarchaeota archaeon LC_2]